MITKKLFNKVKSLYALPIAAISFAAISLASSCSKDELELIGDMERFYDESTGLKLVAGDSIERFATKVESYVIKNPDDKNHPLYPAIKENIKDAAKTVGITLVITINTEWERDTTIYF